MAYFDYIVGPMRDEFCLKMAELLGVPYLPYERRIFPDREVVTRLMDALVSLSGKKVMLISRVRSGCDFHANAYFFELLLMVSALKKMGAGKIEIFMPYLVYGRQDKVFRDGETVTVKVLVATLVQAGAERIFTISPHMAPDTDGYVDFFDDVVPVNTVFAITVWSEIASYIKDANRFAQILEMNPLFVGPDLKAGGGASVVAKLLGFGHDQIEKVRDHSRDDTLVMSEELPSLIGRGVIFIDDIGGTGGTMVSATEMVMVKGTKNVAAVVVHMVAVGNCFERVSTIDIYPFLGTNTIISPFSRVHVEKKAAQVIAQVCSEPQVV